MDFQHQGPSRDEILGIVCDLLGVQEGSLIIPDVLELHRDMRHVAYFGRKLSNKRIRRFQRRIAEYDRRVRLGAVQTELLKGDD